MNSAQRKGKLMSQKLSENQKQTEETFSYKWKEKKQSYESAAVHQEVKRWLIEKYLNSWHASIDDLLGGEERKRILDAGCGSGISGYLLFGEQLKDHEYVGVDISSAIDVAKERFNELQIPASFFRADLNELPDSLGQFDIIFSEGVLHHTDSVEKSIANLASRLKLNGIFLFYVYAKKAPIREYADDLIRDAIGGMRDEQAWEALEPLTKLGKQLGDLNIEIDVPEDIPYLGISRGKFNLQRLFFYKICKAFYRSDYSLEEMNHVNFDWYRPKNCHRHTPEEIHQYCNRAGLSIEKMHVEESGITVISKRKKSTS